MNIKSEHRNESGAALIVALVALVILTLLGVSTMTDVMNQSSVVRNEQFRQKVFYAATSELNVQIDAVNRNQQTEDDAIINDLIDSNATGVDMEVEITETDDPLRLTDPDEVLLSDVFIRGNRRDHFGCPGESVGKVRVIAGEIDATASLDDGRGSIKSTQRQRYVYCWP